jgi:hypothetical protein
MEELTFLGWNIVLIGVVALVGFLYLIGVINKRRKNNFLHKRKPPKGS